jgi:predicted transcriptional regulator
MLARRVGRDVKAVHGDVHALLDAGVLERAEDGRIVFLYDTVHVDFVLEGRPPKRRPAARTCAMNPTQLRGDDRA